jgi:TonB family protein
VSNGKDSWGVWDPTGRERIFSLIEARRLPIILLDQRGRVRDVKVLKGLPLLEEAAVEAVRQWAYTPTLVGGEPAEVILTVTVTFRLR